MVYTICLLLSIRCFIVMIITFIKAMFNKTVLDEKCVLIKYETTAQKQPILTRA